MDRWVLDGDSYSFLRSAPRPINLQNRDGPNRVEIFDITTIPSHRSAISETTCLCDIFGDDCESPLLSSSPASATFLKKEDDRAFPVDDANDSSGSYHTASGSDSGDTTEVTYTTPSPKNIKDFSTCDTRESDSSPIETFIFPDSKNGLNPLHCAPPAIHVNSDDLSHAHNWEKPQVSTSLLNETEKVNVSETQDFNSTVDTTLSTSSKEPFEEREPAFDERAETITTPERTNTSPVLDNLVYSENTESINYHCSEQENFLLAQQMANGRSPSELSNTSETDNNSSLVQKMCTSLADSDNNFIPSLTPEQVTSSTSPVSREISPTPVSLGKSSPVLLNTSDFQYFKDACGTTSPVSLLPTNDNVRIDSPDVCTVSTETQQPVCSRNARERPSSSEINDICSSPDVLAPAHSPELVIIHSPLGYTISPSPTNDRTGYSLEPKASPSPPVFTEVDRSEISSSSDLSVSTRSPEPVIIHLPQSYSSYSSPINEREVYSAEPDASPSSPVITGIDYSDVCSSPDHSIPAHSPGPVLIHSSIDYTISPSPTNERKLYSVEHDDLPSSSVVPGTDYVTRSTYSRGSTPELRSITSTPNSRQNYLTPEPTSPAPSLELRSVTYSPEIKTISCSVLPQYTKSPAFRGIASCAVSPSEDLTSEVQITVCGDNSETSGDDASVSPTSRNCLSTPGSMSRPTSTASVHSRDIALSPDLQPALEASISLKQIESDPLPIICDEMNPFSPSPIDSRHCDDLAHTEISEQNTSVLYECNDTAPQSLSQVQTLQDSPQSPTSVVQMEISQVIVRSDETNDLNMKSIEMKQCHLEVYDKNNEAEILKNDTVSSDKQFSQVPVALSESPGVICSDNSGEYDRQPCREKEESGKREGEGVETMGESSYRGEQVELSFSARNRKGPAGHSPAPSSRDPKSGIPTRCYFESHPTTQQQQSQRRAQGAQQENKGGARRVQSSLQGKLSSSGFLPPECIGETSSMGSEFDEADNEVKWFTDLAFRSLSSPQVDYLDVYNSSHRSSTNVSQPSTNVDSPGAVAWMSYADLRGSTLHENDDPSVVPHDKRFEMESFECVDVALESKEESSRRKRTVPKRQIQLLRRNTDESKPKSNTENVMDSLSTQRASKDILVRQHSTPAFVQEEMPKEEPASPQIARKRTLQKSLSLDDASPKTQMASCIIKNVLSKKMQNAQKETSGNIDLSPIGDKNRHPDISSFDSVQSSIEKHSLSSSQHSECTLSSEDMAVREERSPHHQLKKCAPKVPPKPNFRPAFINTDQAKITGEDTRPKVVHPFKDKALVKPNNKNDKEAEVGNPEEQNNRDTTTARTTSAAVATQTVTMQSRMTKKDTEQQMTQENRRQHGGKSIFMSKTPEITLKPSTIKEKKKSSLKVSLSPDIERSREMCEYQSMEKAAEDVDVTEIKDDSNTKSVIHRVRDVRKFVKNTYNLSFKASNSASEDAVIQEKTEKPPQTPPALHIECKAISWKDKQTDSKAIHCQGETQAVDISKISQPQLATETSRDTDITEITSKASLPIILSTDSQCTTTGGLNEPDKITERSSGHCDQSTTQGMPPRPPSKDREVSALMVIQDGISKTIKNTTVADSNQIKTTCSSHSVSMLLKEKGMQADIGVCDVVTDGVSAIAKHVNRLEVPLQFCLSDAQASTVNRTLSCSPTTPDNSSSRKTSIQNIPQLKPKEQSESANAMLAEESSSQQRKEQEKTKIFATTNLTISGKPEVRSISSNIKNNAMPSTGSKEIELPIQVRSISSDRIKPFVSPKSSYKQSFAEIRSMSSDPPKSDTQITCVTKQQTKLTNEPQKNEKAATLIHKDEVSSNSTKRLAVSAVSSYKPPPIPVTTTASSVQKPTTTFSSVDQQQSSAFLQAPSASQQMTTSFIQDHSILARSFASNTSIKPIVSQTYSHTQPVTRASSHNRFHSEDCHFYASDDPPSYDERESFSPVRVSDLPPQKLCRFHTSTKQSACSCTQTSHTHQGHPQHTSQGRTPPASQSPGQVLTCPGAPPQAQVRPHQCRPDGQALNYLPVSTNTTAPHASALIQPLHHPRACPVPNTQSYGDDLPPPSGLHTDRRPANHHSPQAVGPASYHEYAHPSSLDPRPQLFNPQELPPSFGHDYGSDGPGGASVLYPENASGIGCGQAPRRVLLDPDTGKYFYIEVPMQPLRKMLFDPELGQYVEVLIPQQAMSHSGLYQPAAPPYSSLHNPGLYAPQYLPYAVPSYPAIPSNAQQVRHPEAAPVPTTLHQRYEGPTSQMPKNEPKGHSSLDQSYLESMYYIPTGINASPTSTPSDCYHKPSSGLPPSGGRRV